MPNARSDPPHAALATLEGNVLDEVVAMEFATVFRFGDHLLQIECLWRIVEDGLLRVTSGDNGHPYGLGRPVDAPAEANKLLRGQRVAKVQGGSVRADVVVEFERGLRLEVLLNSSGYEAWQFFDRTGGVRVLGHA